MKTYFLILLTFIFLAGCSEYQEDKNITKNGTTTAEITTSENTEKIVNDKEKIDVKALKKELQESEYYLTDDMDLIYGDIKILEKVNPEKIQILYHSSSIKYDNMIFLESQKMTEVDSESFEDLKEFGFFKDKNFVYTNFNKDENIDVKTFKKVNDWFYQDAKNIFYRQYSNDPYSFDFGFIKIDGIDYDSFKPIIQNVIKDKNGVYYIKETESGIILKNLNIDINTSEKINDYYFRDKNGIYNIEETESGIILENLDIDVNTFEKINDYYFRDKNGIYNKWMKKLNVDVHSAKIVGLFIIDKNTVFEHNHRDRNIEKSQNFTVSDFTDENIKFLKEKTDEDVEILRRLKEEITSKKIDTISFKMLESLILYDSEFFIKDKNGVYFVQAYNNITKIENADPDSFIVNEEKGIAKDKNHLYSIMTGEVITENSKYEIPGYEGKEFISESYLKDKEYIYYKESYNKIIKTNLDIKTFKYLNHGMVKDEKSFYAQGEKIENVDVKSVKILGYDVFKDKNTVFMKVRLKGWKVLKNIDVETFEVLNDLYYKDKHYIFSRDTDGENFYKVEGADYNYFEIISSIYGKDKNNFYKFGIKITDANEIEEIKKGEFH